MCLVSLFSQAVIGKTTMMIEGALKAIAFSLVKIWFRGLPIIKKLLHDLVLKLSVMHLHWHLLNFYGCKLFCKNYTFLLLTFPFYFMIMLVLNISQSIPFIMLTWNMLKLTNIFSRDKCKNSLCAIHANIWSTSLCFNQSLI